MYPKRSERLVAFELGGGIRSGLKRLGTSALPPSQADKDIVFAIIQALLRESRSQDGKEYTPLYCTIGNHTRLEVTRTLIDYAVKWRDIDLWNQLVALIRYSFEVIELHSAILALKTFSFVSLKPRYELIVSSKFIIRSYKTFPSLHKILKSSTLRGLTAILKEIEESCSPDAFTQAWIDTLRRRSISSYSAGEVNDIPALISLAKTLGLLILSQRLVLLRHSCIHL